MVAGNPAWKKGQSGNPAGRPKGSRNKLSESFLESLRKDFERHGDAAVRKVRSTDPAVYLKVIAQVLPKEIKVQHEILEQLDSMTNEELAAELARLNEAVSPADVPGLNMH